VITLSDVLAVVESNERVCPNPQKWHQLYRLLPRKGRTTPALPLILGGWWHSTPVQKQERLREHIHWAADHGALGVVADFLGSLKESDWVHLSEAPSGRVHYDSQEEEGGSS
jgi:hypothetical protein